MRFAMEHGVHGDPFDLWFRPKPFETERLYERLGALVLKRYVPTGGDLVMRWVRRRHPEFRWFEPGDLGSLRRFERRTRLSEAVHLVGFVGFAALAAKRFSAGSLGRVRLTCALALNLVLGLWPVVLQRYNRLRLSQAIEAASRSASHRRTGR